MEQRIYYSPPPHPTTNNSNSNTDPTTTTTNDTNKICQWYCCSCGQSYGSIIYKATSIEEPVSTFLRTHDLHGLKYYSQMSYTNNDHPPPIDVTHIKPDLNHRISQNSDSFDLYQDTIPSRNSSTSSSGSCFSSHIHRTNSTDTEIQSIPPEIETTSNNKEDVILNTPTRFDCHRCNHMMCPYCPKLRLKDLQDKIK
ncbi:hypothetical protein DFJ63DRAFT_338110 [Scheffersomyces coipomensis]|uniref:uncharacterized protein n=1 Tax=Scheffersomyces coipomensis TaxID=1788519 RepID=UPI00315D3C16